MIDTKCLFFEFNYNRKQGVVKYLHVVIKLSIQLKSYFFLINATLDYFVTKYSVLTVCMLITDSGTNKIIVEMSSNTRYIRC